MKWVANVTNPKCSISLLFVQVQILSKLHHPHIISLVGVCLRPKAMLVLEYAELGSLSSMKPYSNMSMPLKHRIALQVCQSGSWSVSVRVMGCLQFVSSDIIRLCSDIFCPGLPPQKPHHLQRLEAWECLAVLPQHIGEGD